MARKLISFAWALKKLLRNKANFGVLEGFLSELLYDDIKIMKILESDLSKNTMLGISNQVDIIVKTSKSEFITIEVHFNYKWDYLQRLIFSTSKAITKHCKKNQKVISINILYFDLGRSSDYIYHGTTNFYGIHNNDELILTDIQKKAFKQNEVYLLKVNNFNDVAKNTLDEWLYFLKNEEIKPSFKAKGLKEAKEKLDRLKLSESIRKQYECYFDAHIHQNSQIWTAVEIGKERIKNNEEHKIAKNFLDVLNDNITA